MASAPRNVVYVFVGCVPDLYYSGRTPEHQNPIVLKFGSTRRRVDVRARELRAQGFRGLTLLATIRDPSEGVEGVERAMHDHLRARRLRCGTFVRDNYTRLTECYVAEPETLALFEDFARVYDFALHREDGFSRDPLDVMAEKMGAATAPEVGDSLSSESERILLEYSLGAGMPAPANPRARGLIAAARATAAGRN